MLTIAGFRGPRLRKEEFVRDEINEQLRSDPPDPFFFFLVRFIYIPLQLQLHEQHAAG